MMDVVEEKNVNDATGDWYNDNGTSENPSTNTSKIPENEIGQEPTSEDRPLSKNQQKKLKRKQDWEDGREERKVRRREKTIERKQRKREAREHEHEHSPQDSLSTANGTHHLQGPRKRQHSVIVPLTILYDCDFDSYMSEGELISLGGQITRAYSDNKKAKFRAHIVISSFSGRLKERFDGLLQKNHESWRGMRFMTDDWQECARLAKEWMKEGKQSSAPAWDGTEKAGVRNDINDHKNEIHNLESIPVNGTGATTDAEVDSHCGTEANDAIKTADSTEVIYLTSDSPETLSTLQPHSTYIIGGIVDKNRHKGLCYKRACDAGVKTAKLPIGDYLKMSSRAVLTTNQVGEIMLRWLECGNWGEAFVSVIPERKGAKLKEEDANSNDDAVSEDGGGDATGNLEPIENEDQHHEVLQEPE